ncbi:MAG: MFS transporter [Candidatus Thorarchaeota archaeon]|nr:MFS transporter [Candidatus Thorarchaeota archaeon]
MSRMKSFLGLPDATEKVLRLAKIMAILGPLANITFVLSSTFYVIFVAEALGGGPGMYLQGMGLVGTLVVIEMVVQISLDYPTGAIGDWIGQRYIIASSNLSFGVAFLLLSFVTVDTPYLYLVLIYGLQGFAQSQSSGAWGAWFDNNYRVAMPGDTDRKQYGVFWGRMGMIMQVVATAALIPGSILAVVFSRAWVFQFQGILAFFFAMITFRLVRDFPEVEEQRAQEGGRPDMGEYFSILKGGVSYLFRNSFVRYIGIGSMIAVSSIMVWGNLILFPMYYLYLITDVGVASFRTLLFIPGIFSQERSGIWSRKFEPKTWIPRFRLMQTCGFIFFWVFAAIMLIFPPAATSTDTLILYWPLTNIQLLSLPVENILPIVLIFTTFVSTSFFGGFAEVLTQRVLIDVIPNRIRNSMYSLFPTIATIFAIPQIALFGWLITIIGFPLTLAACGVTSLIGVLLIVQGFRHEPPEIEGETWANGDVVVPPEPIETIETTGIELIDEELLDEIESGGTDEIAERIHLDD